jgi:hypothetical protein
LGFEFGEVSVQIYGGVFFGVFGEAGVAVHAPAVFDVDQQGRVRFEQVDRRFAGAADAGVAVVVEAAVPSVLVDEVVRADGFLDAGAVGDASDVAGGSGFYEQQGRLLFGRIDDEEAVERDSFVALLEQGHDRRDVVGAEDVVAAVFEQVVPVGVL